MKEIIDMLKMCDGSESRTIAIAKGLREYKGLLKSVNKLYLLKTMED